VVCTSPHEMDALFPVALFHYIGHVPCRLLPHPQSIRFEGHPMSNFLSCLGPICNGNRSELELPVRWTRRPGSPKNIMLFWSLPHSSLATNHRSGRREPHMCSCLCHQSHIWPRLSVAFLNLYPKEPIEQAVYLAAYLHHPVYVRNLNISGVCYPCDSSLGIGGKSGTNWANA